MVSIAKVQLVVSKTHASSMLACRKQNVPSSALSRMFPTRQRLRKDARSQQILHMPLRRTLRLPRPEEPARMPLISIELGIDESGKIVFIVLTQSRHRTGVFPIAAPYGAAARKGAVVAGAFAEAVEPFRTVGLGSGPFTDDGPFVSTCELGSECASGLDVVGG